MMEYTRVTVIGSRRKADLVLPDDHPVDELLPEIIDLLEEPVAAGSPLVLSTLLGQPVDGRTALADQGIEHGALLRLLPADDAPRPPDVAEVTEAVADASIGRPDRWNSRLTAIVVASTIAVVAATAGLLLSLPAAASIILLSSVFLLATVGGAVLSRRDNTSGQHGLLGLCIGVAVPLGLHTAVSLPAQGAAMIPVTLAITWALVWTAVAVVVGIGGRHPGVLTGAALALLSSAVVLVATLSAAPVPLVAAFSGIAAAVVLALAPSFALSTAGVARLDDTAMDGDTVKRTDIDSALATAFASQTALVLALAPPIATTALILGAGNAWQAGLAAALVILVLVRSRLFPFAIARIALLAATVLPAAHWLWTTDMLPQPWPVLISGVIVVLLVVVSVMRPSAAAQARLRRFLGVLESLSAIALIPLLLGILGIFDDLLGAFS
ncbi:type VII secretion integral membrane protein EccD [Microbacterium murale]|uniref:Type VII secretion integral membrane protein EccD n=1 Tax=Microbacterium murale TaxID=1081040 RepID=A0ABU0P5D3_9MICO|nr:type VII secretion integral membrane protein EccD [Microbacterium murale]MDQ0642127.1 type VII secretion integral membrane protein EccD [Microbacterium murale]